MGQSGNTGWPPINFANEVQDNKKIKNKFWLNKTFDYSIIL